MLPYQFTGNAVTNIKHNPWSFHPTVLKKKYDVGAVVSMNNGTAGVVQYQLKEDSKGNIVIMIIGQHTAKNKETILKIKS